MMILQVVEEMSHVHICGDRISSQQTGKSKNPETRMCQPFLKNSTEVSRAGRQI